MLDATSARVDHYRGVLSSSTVCKYRIKDGSSGPKVYRRLFRRYVRDETISTMVGEARTFVPSLLLARERRGSLG